MSLVTTDRIKENCNVVGLNDITLTGTLPGYKSFSSVMSVGDTCYYSVVNPSDGNWEVGIGTLSDPSTLQRTTVNTSSNNNNKVVFASSVRKIVTLSFTAGQLDTYLEKDNSSTVISQGDTYDLTTSFKHTGQGYDYLAGIFGSAMVNGDTANATICSAEIDLSIPGFKANSGCITMTVAPLDFYITDAATNEYVTFHSGYDSLPSYASWRFNTVTVDDLKYYYLDTSPLIAASTGGTDSNKYVDCVNNGTFNYGVGTNTFEGTYNYVMVNSSNTTVTLVPSGSSVEIVGSTTLTKSTRHTGWKLVKIKNNPGKYTWLAIDIDANDIVNSNARYAGLGSNNLTGSQNLQDNELIRAKIRDYSETISSPAITSNTLTLNLEVSNIFEISLNDSITSLVINNPPASGSGGSFTLKFTADGTYRAINWGSAIKWAGNAVPTLTSTSGKIDVFSFFTSDGGTTWLGFAGGQNF